MSSLQQEPSGTFHVVIFLDGKRFKRSLGTKKKSVALALRDEIQETVDLVKRGRLQVPEHLSLIEFAMGHDKETPASPVSAAPAIPVAASMVVSASPHIPMVPQSQLAVNDAIPATPLHQSQPALDLKSLLNRFFNPFRRTASRVQLLEPWERISSTCYVSFHRRSM